MNPRGRWHPWAMLGPTLALLAVFFLIPLGVAAYDSAFAWDMLTPARYVGAANYVALARHGGLFSIALRTLGYSAMVVAGTTATGLGLALLLHREGAFFAFVRTCVFSAYVVSWVAVALLWMWILDGDGGVVGRLTSIPVLGDPRWALPALAAVGTWKLAGYAMVVFSAGLEALPPSLLEAAALDGAGTLARLRHVILPALAPTSAFVATTSLATSFQAFDAVRIMTQGGPANATQLFVYAIYEEIFLDLRVGRASALTVVFFLLLCALTGAQLALWRRRAEGAR